MNKWIRWMCLVEAAVILLALLPTAASAGAGDVVVGGMPVIRVRTAAGGMSAEARADIVERRITNVLSQSRAVPPVTVRVVDGEPTVFAGDMLVITADAHHARLNGTSRHALAEVWAEHLRAALPNAVPLPQPAF